MPYFSRVNIQHYAHHQGLIHSRTWRECCCSEKWSRAVSQWIWCPSIKNGMNTGILISLLYWY